MKIPAGPVRLVQLVLSVLEDIRDRTRSTSPGRALRLISLIDHSHRSQRISFAEHEPKAMTMTAASSIPRAVDSKETVVLKSIQSIHSGFFMLLE